MANELPVPVTGTEEHGQPAASPAAVQQTDWMAKADELQTRMGGLQAKYQKEREKWQADTAKLMEYEDKLKSLSGEKEALSLQHKSAQEKLELAQTEAEILKGNEARLRTVIAKFPELIPFESKGLLPDGAGDELEAKLTEFKSTLLAAGVAAVQQVASGAVAPPPVPAPVADSKQMMLEAIAALKDGRLADYEAKSAQYVTMASKEKAK